jgi:hypothetical protein
MLKLITVCCAAESEPCPLCCALAGTLITRFEPHVDNTHVINSSAKDSCSPREQLQPASVQQILSSHVMHGHLGPAAWP